MKKEKWTRYLILTLFSLYNNKQGPTKYLHFPITGQIPVVFGRLSGICPIPKTNRCVALLSRINMSNTHRCPIKTTMKHLIFLSPVDPSRKRFNKKTLAAKKRQCRSIESDNKQRGGSAKSLTSR